MTYQVNISLGSSSVALGGTCHDIRGSCRWEQVELNRCFLDRTLQLALKKFLQTVQTVSRKRVSIATYLIPLLFSKCSQIRKSNSYHHERKKETKVGRRKEGRERERQAGRAGECNNCEVTLL